MKLFKRPQATPQADAVVSPPAPQVAGQGLLQIALSSADGRPIYLQIMDEMRRAIVLGVLSAEDPLPSVRQLASELRLNPNTVAQAYRELEREGVVYVRRGQGTFVANRSTGEDERGALAEGVATRALMDAHRHGFGAEELIAAIRRADSNLSENS